MLIWNVVFGWLWLSPRCLWEIFNHAVFKSSVSLEMLVVALSVRYISIMNIILIYEWILVSLISVRSCSTWTWAFNAYYLLCIFTCDFCLVVYGYCQSSLDWLSGCYVSYYCNARTDLRCQTVLVLLMRMMLNLSESLCTSILNLCPDAHLSVLSYKCGCWICLLIAES